MLRPIYTYNWRPETELHAILDHLEAKDGLLTEREHRHYQMILYQLKQRELNKTLRLVQREIRRCEDEELSAIDSGEVV